MTEPIIIRPLIVIVMILLLVGIHILAALTDFPAFIQLFFQANLTVYLGCFMSNKVRKNEKNETIRQEKEETTEIMQQKDALLFPVYGSLVLGSLYAAFKLLPSEYLNFVFTAYFSLIGLFCLANFIELPISKIIGHNRMLQQKKAIFIDKKFNINLIFSKKEFELKLNQYEILCLALSIVPTIYYAFTKNWVCNNIFGIAFSIIGIGNLSLGTFKTGFIMLWGLFFYDIFWVYGTDVMVTVAQNFNVPIKLVFPYQWVTDGETGVVTPKFSILGLGDIVIPGIFVALCLKCDLDKRLKNSKNIHDVSTPLFNWCFGGYVLGIITTYFILVWFNHAQPALLYLVPGCSLGSLIGAHLNGGIGALLKYADEEPIIIRETGDDKKKSEKATEKKQD